MTLSLDTAVKSHTVSATLAVCVFVSEFIEAPEGSLVQNGWVTFKTLADSALVVLIKVISVPKVKSNQKERVCQGLCT